MGSEIVAVIAPRDEARETEEVSSPDILPTQMVLSRRASPHEFVGVGRQLGE
jgi:hypothetical protein